VLLQFGHFLSFPFFNCNVDLHLVHLKLLISKDSKGEKVDNMGESGKAIYKERKNNI
jgi:hypothetical protein